VIGLLLAATQSPTATGQSQLGGSGEEVLFWVMAVIMVPAALGLLLARKAVHAALCMAVVMVGLGIVYLAEQAPFLGVVQIFVYAGAVMMLFLFLLMLVGVDSSDSLIETIKGQRWLALVFGAALAILLTSVLGHVTYGTPKGLNDVDSTGNMTAIAALIFGKYVWAFEVTSALLITAVLGAMILAHRERLTPKPTQRELSIKRIREGAVKAPLPAPGVFARHNAVDIPALLPDGTPSELSLSRVLTARGQMRQVGTVREDVAIIEAEITPAHQRKAQTVPDDGTGTDSFVIQGADQKADQTAGTASSSAEGSR
jgi:NADH-quinone oxidoreductase subunit J